MKQKTINFRELIERLLPLDELPAAERFAVERALKSGVAGQLQKAALHALEQLERRGAVRRLPSQKNGGDPAVLRYQSRDRLDLITIHLPAPARRDGLVVFPRTGLPSHAQASLEQVRRLLRLEDEPWLTDARSAHARLGLIPQLDRVGREFLGASEVRLIQATGPEEVRPDAPLDPALAREAAASPDLIFYCPDASACPPIAATARARGARAAVLVGLPRSAGPPLGHLEILSAELDPFRPEDLAMAALLADYCGAALERSAQLEKLVFIDPLTSVYNRSYFDLEVNNEMARAQRESASMALCIADIDDFKKFNTTYGYEAGNQVLAEVAQALKRAVRPFDTVARWGGEEFALLLTAPIHAEDVVAISERLRSLVERQSVKLEGLDRRSYRVGVTVSLGVALFPDHARDPSGLWRAANQALLKAKRPPKNQVVFYQPVGDQRFQRG